MNGERIDTDVLIIGSGGAGATAAIEASKPGSCLLKLKGYSSNH